MDFEKNVSVHPTCRGSGRAECGSGENQAGVEDVPTTVRIESQPAMLLQAHHKNEEPDAEYWKSMARRMLASVGTTPLEQDLSNA